MSKKISIEIGLCTKDMAKENPIKDFEILIEEHKEKWSKQMYDYFKECLNEIKKKEKVLEIIRTKDVNTEMIKLSKDYFEYYASTYKVDILTQEEYDLLKEVLS